MGLTPVAVFNYFNSHVDFAEEAGRRPLARQGDAAGRDPPKNMKPARKRQMVDEVRSVWQISIRRACQALPVDRSTYHYRSKRTGQAILMKRIKEIPELVRF